MSDTNWRDDTITSFPAITGDTQILPAATEQCPCGMHTPAEPGKDTLLSCAPGVTSRMWRTRVANGQWDDIHALWDKGHARTHMPALEHQRRIHAALAAMRHDLGVMFGRNPGLLSDRIVSEGLRDLEGRLAGRLVQMQTEADMKGEVA